jgi:hypothetical protein
VSRKSVENTPIGIQDEGNMPHLTIGKTLFEGNPKAFKTRTCLLDIAHGDSDVTKAPARFSIAAGVALEVRVRLGAVVVSELKDAWYIWAREFVRWRLIGGNFTLAVETSLGLLLSWERGDPVVAIGEEVKGEVTHVLFCCIYSVVHSSTWGFEIHLTRNQVHAEGLGE